MLQQKIIPNLWFDGQAVEAAEFYCSIFKNSRVVSTVDYTDVGPGEPGTVMVVEWELDGQRFVGINGGPDFTFNSAVSFQVECEDQAEIDYFWDALLADGGQEVQCGWLTDKYGLSWQVTPKGMDQMFAHPDKDRANRAMAAMMKMVKFDIAELERAADGVSA